MQVLYVKDNVWVWPCRSSRIMGRLQLTLSRDILYIYWLPYPTGRAQVRHISLHLVACIFWQLDYSCFREAGKQCARGQNFCSF